MVGATGFALRKFSDENFARARPRGFCLLGFCPQTKTSLWASNPDLGKAVCLLRLFIKNKNPLVSGLVILNGRGDWI